MMSSGDRQMQTANNSHAQGMQGVLARAQQDETFRAWLMTEPRAALGDAGVPIPPAIQLRTIDAAPRTTYLVLPPAPAEGEVSDAELTKASGGAVTALLGAVLLVTFMVTAVYGTSTVDD